MVRRSFTFLPVVLVLLLAVMLACGGSGGLVGEEGGWTVVEDLGPKGDLEGPEPKDTEQAPRRPTRAPVTGTAPVTVQATGGVEATVQATPASASLRLVARGFGQDGKVVGYGFKVANSDEELAVEGAEYRVTAYDAGGAIVKTESHYLTVVDAGQTLGVAGVMYVEDGLVVDSLDVQLSGGNVVVAERPSTFGVSNVVFHTDELLDKVTGVIENPFQRDYRHVRVSALLYDGNDEIVGGGFTFVNFVPASGSTGLDMSVESNGEIARVEVYATLSNLSLVEGQAVPADATAPILQKWGFGQDGIRVGYGMLLENANAGYMVESMVYRVTAYGANDVVLGVDEGFAPLLFPQQTTGVGGDLYLATEQTVERVEVHIGGGSYEVPDESRRPFTVEEPVFREGRFASYAVGFVVNPYEQNVTDLRVSGIAYNGAGDIVGGGFTFLDFASARERTAVEASIVTAEIPERVELYAAWSSLSGFE